MEMELGYEKGLQLQLKKERAAVKLQSKVGELLYEKGIELVLFRNHLQIQRYLKSSICMNTQKK